MLVFGGRTAVGDGTALNDLHSFSLEQRRWSSISTSGNAPAARSYHAATSVGDDLYIFGGCSTFGRLADLHKLDTTSGKWTELPSSDKIKPRGGAGLTAVGTSLYLVGGFCGHELSDVHIFDTVSRTWTELVLPNSVKLHLSPKEGETGELPARSVFGLAAVKLRRSKPLLCHLPRTAGDLHGMYEVGGSETARDCLLAFGGENCSHRPGARGCW
ncbi:hypothetical protein WJX73_004863 [Symbiochloris irregularis]|uniref:Uncharacterized protein n=1 Tax=Symbiochloris irregularis TaxID=706552 RepID=A0AAW1PJ38_9CHLO